MASSAACWPPPPGALIDAAQASADDLFTDSTARPAEPDDVPATISDPHARLRPTWDERWLFTTTPGASVCRSAAILESLQAKRPLPARLLLASGAHQLSDEIQAPLTCPRATPSTRFALAGSAWKESARSAASSFPSHMVSESSKASEDVIV